MKIGAIIKNIVNLIYPLRCVACGKRLDATNEAGVCNTCFACVKINPKPHCNICGRSTEMNNPSVCPECRKARFHFKSARSVCLHEGVIKDIIHAFKYKGKVSLSGLLSRLMTDFIKDNCEILKDVDAITFVPMQKMRLRKRGFNQSRILAHGISKEFGISLLDALEKTGRAKPQNELPRKERLTNVKCVFRVSQKYGNAKSGEGRLTDLNILLIDDVMATGATLDDSARALLASGVKEVRCLTLSRGV